MLRIYCKNTDTFQEFQEGTTLLDMLPSFDFERPYDILSAKVNKWSGTKPFRSSAESYTYAELVAALKAANYGLNIQGDSTPAAALNRAAGNDEIWPYLKPQNTANSPCRQGDFRGYNHDAPVPYSSSASANNGTRGLSNGSFEFTVDQASGAEVLAAQMNAIKNGKWVLLWRVAGGSA